MRCKKTKIKSHCAAYIALISNHAHLEEALLKHSIPYKIIGGIQFYERKEIKDILAYLRLVVNPFDRPSFFRVINCPLRGLAINLKNISSDMEQRIYLQHLKILHNN